MNNYRKLLHTAAFSAVFAAGLGSAFAASADSAARPARLEAQVEAATAANQSLQAVVVTGSGNAFLRSDQRLARLNASLPLDAQDGAAQPSGLQRVAALFPRSPNAATGEPRRMMERGHGLPGGSDPDGNLGLGEQ